MADITDRQVDSMIAWWNSYVDSMKDVPTPVIKRGEFLSKKPVTKEEFYGEYIK